MRRRPQRALFPLAVLFACGEAAPGPIVEPPPPEPTRRTGPLLPERPSAQICFSALDDFPERISQTGCFDGAVPAADLIPYDVQTALWTDGASKLRWFVLPPNRTATVADDGFVDLPDGSIIVKQFGFDAPLETRFMVRRGARWTFATYEWNEDGTDAARLHDVTRRKIGEVDYRFPSETECEYCHSRASGLVLGLHAAQLDGLYDYDGDTKNQLDVLRDAGLLTGDASSSPLPEPSDESVPLEARVRAYLHVNCAHCHQPGGWSSPSLTLDLRYELPLAETGLCDDVQFFRPPGTPRIAAGDPDSSDLFERMRTEDALERMPPIGLSVIDAEGIALVEAWIRSLESCP